MEKENEVDQLFKRGLSDPEIPFNELDWEKMERKLDAQEKKRVIPLWLFRASGVAAVLAIFLFWLFFTPAHMDKNAIKNSTVNHTVKPGIKNEVQAKINDTLIKPLVNGEGLAANGIPSLTAPAESNPDQPSNPVAVPVEKTVIGVEASVQLKNGMDQKFGKDNIAQIVSPVGKVVSPSGKGAAPLNNTPVNTIQPQKTVIPLTENQMVEQKANALARSKDQFGKTNADDVADMVKKKMENSLGQSHNLILSAMAAPDISTVPSGKSGKVSTNVGMLATYALGSKFSVTSGAVYAKKYYNSSGSTTQSIYAPGVTTEQEIYADCNVLDIPLNVNYKLTNKKSLSVSVNTGLSSYFMLKEKYQVVTGQGATQQSVPHEFDNQNQHILGVANVSVSFDHQISPNLSVGVQPFAKLPLTGIGQYDYKLRSTGVSFTLSIGLFPAKKPGKLASNNYSGYRYSGL